jgi:hypothetical protein
MVAGEKVLSDGKMTINEHGRYFHFTPKCYERASGREWGGPLEEMQEIV